MSESCKYSGLMLRSAISSRFYFLNSKVSFSNIQETVYVREKERGDN